jgi:TonB family protein
MRSQKASLTALAQHPENTTVRQHTVSQLSHGNAARAERDYDRVMTGRQLGTLYAHAVLGVIGDDPRTGEPIVATADDEFAARAARALEQTTHRELIVSAARTLAGSGRKLYAAGKIDTDYTPILKPLLARARQLAPGDLWLITLGDDLPARGEFIPPVIRVGGKVQADKLLRQPKPVYPREAITAGVQGTVRMTVLLSPEGKVASLEVTSGPPELVNAAVDSVRQWEYRPTLLNGRPVYVMTVIDVNFTLSQ